MESNKISNSDKLIASLCYIPLWWIIMFFIQKNKSSFLMKHIKYSTSFFIWYLIARMIFWWLFLHWMFIGWILFLVYLILSIVFWIKAYNWEDFDIEVIDNIYSWDIKEKISKKNNTNKKQNEDFEEFDDTDIKTGNIVVDKLSKGITKVVWNVKKDQEDVFDETGSNKKQNKSKKDYDILDF